MGKFLPELLITDCTNFVGGTVTPLGFIPESFTWINVEGTKYQ